MSELQRANARARHFDQQQTELARYRRELAAAIEADMNEWMASDERIYLSATFARDIVAFRRNHPVEQETYRNLDTLQDLWDWSDCTGMDESKIEGLS